MENLSITTLRNKAQSKKSFIQGILSSGVNQIRTILNTKLSGLEERRYGSTTHYSYKGDTIISLYNNDNDIKITVDYHNSGKHLPILKAIKENRIYELLNDTVIQTLETTNYLTVQMVDEQALIMKLTAEKLDQVINQITKSLLEKGSWKCSTEEETWIKNNWIKFDEIRFTMKNKRGQLAYLLNGSVLFEYKGSFPLEKYTDLIHMIARSEVNIWSKNN